MSGDIIEAPLVCIFFDEGIENSVFSALNETQVPRQTSGKYAKYGTPKTSKKTDNMGVKSEVSFLDPMENLRLYDSSTGNNIENIIKLFEQLGPSQHPILKSNRHRFVANPDFSTISVDNSYFHNGSYHFKLCQILADAPEINDYGDDEENEFEEVEPKSKIIRKSEHSIDFVHEQVSEKIEVEGTSISHKVYGNTENAKETISWSKFYLGKNQIPIRE